MAPDSDLSVSSLRSDHIGETITLVGSVVATGPVETDFDELVQECESCGSTQEWSPESSVTAGSIQPCPDCGEEDDLRIDQSESSFIDRQRIRVEERPSGVIDSPGRESITVELYGDEVGSVQAGKTVRLTGVLHLASPNEFFSSTIADKFVAAESVEAGLSPIDLVSVSDSDVTEFLQIADSTDVYKKIVGSIAPTVEGMWDQKLAIALQLASGVRKRLPDEREIRGKVHILLIGDPGTAKTELIRAAARLAPRAVYTDGANTTGAGLTGSAERVNDGLATKRRWEIDGGAVIRADEGLACLDNLGEFNGTSLAKVTEPMANQVVEVSKGSTTKTLDAAASVLATGNPKYGKFDMYEPVSDQLDLPPDLISVFDLVFTLEEDESSSHTTNTILDASVVGEVAAGGESEQVEADTESLTSSLTPEIEPEILRKYIAYARKNCFPVLTDEAKEVLKRSFEDLQSEADAEDSPVPVTARSLEAMVRLAEAHARLRLSDTVEEADADVIVGLVESSFESLGIDMETGEFDPDIVVSGTGESPKELRKKAKKLLRDIDEDYPDRPGAPRDGVYSRSGEIGISRSGMEDLIENLKHRGDIYFPDGDHIKVV